MGKITSKERNVGITNIPPCFSLRFKCQTAVPFLQCNLLILIKSFNNFIDQFCCELRSPNTSYFLLTGSLAIIAFSNQFLHSIDEGDSSCPEMNLLEREKS
jgi:hypothetical protein